MYTRKIVVSAITNGYSLPRSVVKFNPTWNYYMFVDREDYDIPKPWKTIYIPDLHNRAPKILTHKFIEDWDVMIWVDGSVTLTEDPDLILQLLGKSYMLTRRHTRAKNVFEDINKCILNGRVNPDKAIKVFAEYASYPNGVLSYDTYLEMGFFVRVNNPETNSMMEAWANEFFRIDIGRDQPAFAKVVRPEFVKIIDPYKTKLIQVGWHTQKRLEVKSTKPVIHYITLLCKDKRIREYLDETLKGIPEDHWVCLLDSDSMFLDSSDGEFLSKIVEKYPDTHLFGCMTNRQGLHWQVEEAAQFENTDMVYHKRTAQLVRLREGYRAPEINIPIAGQFMLFPKWLFNRIGFQDNLVEEGEDNPIYFDWDFCYRLLLEGGKIRLIKGLYRYHFYRSDKGAFNTTHLHN